MLNSRLILIAACLVAATTAAAVNETTNCPLDVEHKCEFCAYDSNRYGCYCEDTELVTADIFTSCIPDVGVEPCDSNPCKNGANCTRTSVADYKCDCASGFGGATCETPLPKCGDAGIKCVNAECVNTGHEDLPVYCQCYDGTRRDPRKNDTCPQSPCYEPNTETPICQNGGTCQIYNSAPVCQCKDGYAGQVCDKTLKSPLCSSNLSVCGNGKCQQSLTPPYYSCYCGNYPSTFGKTLADLVPCEQSGCYHTNPCQNGGTCSNKAGGFVCQCPPRYTGFRCEKQSACYNNPCKNNGVCEAFNETAYFCTCPAYFTGKQCETVVPNPCIGKNCGPHGVCQDSAGVALCKCSNGLQSDGSLCEDPCTKLNCNTGVCATKINATYEAYCACPVTRKGEHCELPNDVCREKPPCGGGYCKTNYAAPNGYSCVCEGAAIKNQPCGFSSSCPIKNCGTQGLCVQTDGLIVPPATLPIHYVCSCLKGYITTSDCDGLLADLTNYDARCGNGKAYPSRNPSSPVGCWCNNGTHIPEIELTGPTGLCV